MAVLTTLGAGKSSPLGKIGKSVGKTIGKSVKKVGAAPSAGVDLSVLGGLQRQFENAAASGYFDEPEPDYSYLDTYSAGLSQARSAIQAQMQAALNEISQREGIANQALAQMPADLNAIYQPAQAQTTQMADALAQGQAASGLTPFVPASAMAAPIQAALSTSLSSRLADVPYLRAGAQASFGKQRAAIQQDGGSQLADLDLQQAQMAQDAAARRAELAAAQQDAQAKRKQDLEDRTAAYEHDKEMARLQARLSGSKEKAKDQVTWGRFEVDPNRGGMIAADRPDLAESIRSGKDRATKAYHKVLKDLRKNPPKDAEDLLERLNKYKKNHRKYPRAISLALFDAGIAGG